jgi:outer membrane protein OmpA-like peptidoglycan-associated protein
MGVDSLRLARNNGLVQLVMDISVSGQKTPHDNIYILTPRLVGESGDSIDFPPIVAYGRNAYYHDVRQGNAPPDISPEAYKIRLKNGPRIEHYARTVEHQQWMDNSTLKLILSDGTPCTLLTAGVTHYKGFRVLPPDTTIVEHQDSEQDEQTGSVSGQARIQFIVNRTEFVPTLGNNKHELDSMRQSIISVQQNPDVRITKYRIKGYASPEGPYLNNVNLARGRTERIRQFMVDKWGVPEQQIEIDFQPEDWAGFRDYMVEHHDDYADADDIISLIDTDDNDLDHKLAVIAARHPASYRRILVDCFPYLRRTDYHIDYDWLRIVERKGETRLDTVITYPNNDVICNVIEDNVYTRRTPTRPWIAVKTNLLFDLAMTPNIELEAQLGRDSRWSIMVEDWFPWFLHNKKDHLEIGTYRKPGNYMYKYAYELWALGAEVRYWFKPSCVWNRPTLTGTFLGVYGAAGKYDWEYDSNGDQGDFTSAGITFGHSWVLAKHWNFELSASLGAVWGPRRHYHGEFDDTHLIWKYTKDLFYIGPTKLKASIVWLVPSFKKYKQKGGAYE